MKWTNIFFTVLFCIALPMGMSAKPVFAQEFEDLETITIQTIDELLEIIENEEHYPEQSEIDEYVQDIVIEPKDSVESTESNSKFRLTKFNSGEISNELFLKSNQKDIRLTLDTQLSFELLAFFENFHLLFDGGVKGYYSKDLTMRQSSYTVTFPKIQIDFWENSARFYALFLHRSDYFFSTTKTDMIKKAEAGFMFNPEYIGDERNNGFQYLGQKYFSISFEKYFPDGRINYQYGVNWEGGTRLFKWKKALFYSEINGKLITVKDHRAPLLFSYNLEVGVEMLRDEPIDAFVSVGTEEDDFGWRSGRHNFIMIGTRYRF